MQPGANGNPLKKACTDLTITPPGGGGGATIGGGANGGGAP